MLWLAWPAAGHRPARLRLANVSRLGFNFRREPASQTALTRTAPPTKISAKRQTGKSALLTWHPSEQSIVAGDAGRNRVEVWQFFECFPAAGANVGLFPHLFKVVSNFRRAFRRGRAYLRSVLWHY